MEKDQQKRNDGKRNTSYGNEKRRSIGDYDARYERKRKKNPAISYVVSFVITGVIIWTGYLFFHPEGKEWLREKGILREEKTGREAEKKISDPGESPRVSSSKDPGQAQKPPSLREKQEMYKMVKELGIKGVEMVREQNFPAAEKLYRRRMEIYRRLGGVNLPGMSAMHSDLAYTLFRQKKFQEAEEHYLMAVEAAKANNKEASYSMAYSREGLGNLYLETGRLEEAEKAYLAAMSIWNALRGPGNTNTLMVLEKMAEVYTRLEETQKLVQTRSKIDRIEAELYQKNMEARKRKAKKKEALPAKPESPTGKTANPGQDSGSGVSNPAKRLDDGTYEITVKLTESFVPAGFVMAISSPFAHRLSESPPGHIRGEPLYNGFQQYYGTMRLGTYPDNQYDFVLDGIGEANPVMYFDKNNNEDLSDDGPGLRKAGTGIFGAHISIPLKYLIREFSHRSEEFNIWFYINDASWKIRSANHYSRTHLKGSVILGGDRLPAGIIETGVNDADFTNDGIWIDLNGNGKMQSKNELIREGEVLDYNGKSFRFRIIW